ncbi:MAG: fructosamine kinase family protein, partial [Gammaproteobacteria bacterium]|nr:fructosamine kinase family protein [Gammaproteobacteria bacterium]
MDDVLADLERRGIRASRAAAEVGGGSISRTLRIESDGGPLLLKIESAERADMLAAEHEALEAIAAARAVAVPAVIAQGAAGRAAYLAIEWIDFAAKTDGAAHALGVALARLHRSTAASFGWHRDNFIGTTPQRNDRSDDWARFYRDMRLAPQLELARRNGLSAETLRLGTQLLGNVERLLRGHAPAPSLLHGDLWGGN